MKDLLSIIIILVIGDHKDPLFLRNNAVYITGIYTYCTLKIYLILKVYFFSSIRNFLIDVFIFYNNFT